MTKVKVPKGYVASVVTETIAHKKLDVNKLAGENFAHELVNLCREHGFTVTATDVWADGVAVGDTYHFDGPDGERVELDDIMKRMSSGSKPRPRRSSRSSGSA